MRVDITEFSVYISFPPLLIEMLLLTLWVRQLIEYADRLDSFVSRF